MKRVENKRDETIRVMLPFLIMIVITFLIAVSLSWGIIFRLFARLGFGPPIGIMAEQNFSYTIPSSQLQVGSVVGYYSFANDSAGNQNMTNMTGPVRTFKVIYPENITDIHIENENNKITSSIQQGHHFYVFFNITNERSSDVTRRYIVQLVDPDGKITQSIFHNNKTVSPGQEEKKYETFIANKLGNYKAQVFIWTDWASVNPAGFPIASSEEINFESVSG